MSEALKKELVFYGSYHSDAVNKLIHAICVPLLLWTVISSSCFSRLIFHPSPNAQPLHYFALFDPPSPRPGLNKTSTIILDDRMTQRLNPKEQTLAEAYDLPANFLEIDVLNPETHGVANKRYTDYEVRLKTNLPIFRIQECTVRRRYSDFEWLRGELEKESKIIVPTLPGKALKRMLPFRGDDGIHRPIARRLYIQCGHPRQISIFEEEFIEERRQGIESFINKIAGHPLAQNEKCLHMFLTEAVIAMSEALKKELVFYGSYHSDAVNKLIHAICVPLLLWTGQAMLSPVGVGTLGGYEVTVSALATSVYILYYIYLYPALGMITLPILSGMVSFREGIFEEEFIEERRQGIESFINKIAGHPLAQNEKCLHMFLTEAVIAMSEALKKELVFYGSYHSDAVNKLIHAICVPLLLWTGQAMLSPVGVGTLGGYEVTVSALATSVYILYYIYLYPALGMITLPILSGMVSFREGTVRLMA
eukprot:sb/3464287/